MRFYACFIGQPLLLSGPGKGGERVERIGELGIKSINGDSMKQHSTGQSTEEWVNKLKCKEEETG